MRSLLVKYPGDFAIVGPVKRDRLYSFELLINYLHQQWHITHSITESVLQISDRLSSLFPRLDKPGHFGFNTRSLTQSEFESLFLAQVINEEMRPCKLIELHTFKEEGTRRKKEGETLTPGDIPIKSSGLPDADLFASLVAIDESIEGALLMWRQFDSEFLSRFISQLNERRRDPQERMNEYLKDRFNEWKQQNKQEYYKNLGFN
ncbi:hypothetical protein ACX27_04305 [Nostoc piscinale CENA21]|uniref:Uncharacterized protein n=1 Tax=Nostoc piscinale CENA21 TaxID=224013 RepID=A0A0M4TU94_9NOSO|nr:hypothetical protein [Nostoc piscinale]ALF52251.1 hypothetical protein ACX27_04305 [Nostoc piscinale CENA21]